MKETHHPIVSLEILRHKHVGFAGNANCNGKQICLFKISEQPSGSVPALDTNQGFEYMQLSNSSRITPHWSVISFTLEQKNLMSYLSGSKILVILLHHDVNSADLRQ